VTTMAWISSGAHWQYVAPARSRSIGLWCRKGLRGLSDGTPWTTRKMRIVPTPSFAEFGRPRRSRPGTSVRPAGKSLHKNLRMAAQLKATSPKGVIGSTTHPGHLFTPERELTPRLARDGSVARGRLLRRDGGLRCGGDGFEPQRSVSGIISSGAKCGLLL
jgi:hypothetical protein